MTTLDREPAWVWDALLDRERFDGLIWDPCCGAGTGPTACVARGLRAIGTDLVDRGYSAGAVTDFFDTDGGARNIASNPPYRDIDRFITTALAKASDKVAVFARLLLLEGQARGALLKSTPLARIWIFSRRVSVVPSDIQPSAHGGAIPYAWFVWEHGHRGPIITDLIP